MLRKNPLLSSRSRLVMPTIGIVNARDAVRRVTIRTATTAKMAVVVPIVATIFATVESAFTVTAGRSSATFAKVMAVGGLVSQVQSGAKIDRWMDAKM